MTDAHPRLQKWRERMGARPAVRRVGARWGASWRRIGRPVPGFLRSAMLPMPET